jgi:aspartate/methionine/tyrosine aminotransferase
MPGWLGSAASSTSSPQPRPASPSCAITCRSFELAERIRQEASVLLAPGGYLGAEQHLRITLGYEPEKVRAALERVSAVVAGMLATP